VALPRVRLLDQQAAVHPRPEGLLMAPFPHCNSDTIHAPGACYYCDLYADLQLERANSGRPYSSLEANGWSGNVAVRAGELHSHMGATFVVGEEPAPLREWDRGTPAPTDASVAELALHMTLHGDVFVPVQRRCDIRFKPGWWCGRNEHSTGPCALQPRWWNLRGRWQAR
jgi:hypothetical protein